MVQRRKIEVFTAGFPCCTAAVELVKFLASEHAHGIEACHFPLCLPLHLPRNAQTSRRNQRH